MLIYNMRRERKFPMTITNLAALFLELFEPPLYNILQQNLHLVSYIIVAFGSGFVSFPTITR